MNKLSGINIAAKTVTETVKKAAPVARKSAAAKNTVDQTQSLIDREMKFTANNYKSIPVMLTRGRGGFVWDVNGKKYDDFLCGYSSLNQGHNHPKIVAAMIKQAKKLSHTSRAFHNDKLGEYSEYVTQLLGYDKILPMNSGVEAVETACKIARKWGYTVKGVEEDKAVILFPTDCFWGRTITAISGCDDPIRRTNFGPFTPGFEMVKYNDIQDLKEKFEADKNIVAYCMEPIQGEAGVIIPDDGYMLAVQNLCK